MARDLLIIFVKAPRPGFVKTRLAKSIGAQPACDAYLALVGILIGNLHALGNVQIRFTPDDALSEITRWAQTTWSAAPQGQGDLGERLIEAFREAFKTGAARVVVIGSDSPDITPADIDEAWNALGENDVVLGPAEDGGYWLIGLRAEQVGLFANMPWGTSDVFAETTRRATAAELSTHLLRKLSDIDTVEDLRRFQSRATPGLTVASGQPSIQAGQGVNS